MDDLISRQAAIDTILADKIDDTSLKVMTALGDGRLALTLNSACDRHIQDIKKLPSTESKRESIKWIPHESVFGGLGERVYTCDKCGHNIGFHVENFCPNCGGKYER